MRFRLPLARLASVLLFAALCAIVAGWAMQLLAPRPPIAPAGSVAQAASAPDLSAAGQLFGGVPRPVAEAAQAGPSNVQVAGVLAAGARGVALLAIDGRPAKAFAVGDEVTDGMTLRSVTGDAVELERGGRPMTLPAPARGSLAVLTSGPVRSGATAPPVPGVVPPAAQRAAQPPVAPYLPPLPPAGAAAPPQEPTVPQRPYGMPPPAQGMAGQGGPPPSVPPQ